MPEIALSYPVYTLDHQILLSSGTLLSEETMVELAKRGRRDHSYSLCSLFDHGTALQDLQSFINNPPYNAIFSDPRRTADCLKLMGEVEMVGSFLAALDHFHRHDPYTYRHMLMVFALTTLLAQDLITEYRDCLRQSFAGPTHDFGKICVPLPVLKKPTPLTREERRQMEHHPLAGYVLLSYYMQDHRHFSAQVARDHHERKDGSGYPRGRSELDPLVEIISVCDVYDALISPRPYRPVCFDNRTALEEITRLAEAGKIGWYVIKALVAHNRRVKFDPDKIWVSPEKRGTMPTGNCYGTFAEPDNSPIPSGCQ